MPLIFHLLYDRFDIAPIERSTARLRTSISQKHQTRLDDTNVLVFNQATTAVSRGRDMRRVCYRMSRNRWSDATNAIEPRSHEWLNGTQKFFHAYRWLASIFLLGSTVLASPCFKESLMTRQNVPSAGGFASGDSHCEIRSRERKMARLFLQAL